MKISGNILSLTAQRNLSNTTKALSRAMQRLASGQRVNSARDDAAGLAIGNGFETQRRGMLQAVRNMNDARGFLDTAESSMATQADLVQRMRELAMQAANGTLSDSERKYLDNEAQQLLEEFQRITEDSEFNGVKLLDGNFGNMQLQVGTEKGDTIVFTLSSMQSGEVFAGSALYITTQSSAEDSLEVLDSALGYINSARSRIGAIQSRLDFAQSVAESTISNISSAKSQLMDTDYSIETAEFTRLQILQQAGIAVLTKANMSTQLTLKLLENV